MFKVAESLWLQGPCMELAHRPVIRQLAVYEDPPCIQWRAVARVKGAEPLHMTSTSHGHKTSYAEQLNAIPCLQALASCPLSAA